MTKTGQSDSFSDGFQKPTAFEIDDADVELDRLALGVWSAAHSQRPISTATPEAIRSFAHGYGDDNPLYTEPAYGMRTRWGSQIAPPMMAAVLNAPLRGDPVPVHLRGGIYRGLRSLASGGIWEWYRPIYPGDTLYSFSGLEFVEESSECAARSVTRTVREVKINQRGEVVGAHHFHETFTDGMTARKDRKHCAETDWAYTAEDIAESEYAYAGEQVRGDELRYWEDVVVDDTLRAVAKNPRATTGIISFLAGGCGFVPYGFKTARDCRCWQSLYVRNGYGVHEASVHTHLETDWGRAVGNPRADGYGLLRECWIHHFLTDWVGDAAFVASQRCEISDFRYPGNIQLLTGRVIGKRREDGMMLVDLAVEVRNARLGITTIQADATISLPSREFGAATLPATPHDLQRDAIRMFERHSELA